MVAKSESPVANYEAKHNTLGHTGTIDHGIFMGFCPSSTAGFRKQPRQPRQPLCPFRAFPPQSERSCIDYLRAQCWSLPPSKKTHL